MGKDGNLASRVSGTKDASFVHHVPPLVSSSLNTTALFSLTVDGQVGDIGQWNMSAEYSGLAFSQFHH